MFLLLAQAPIPPSSGILPWILTSVGPVLWVLQLALIVHVYQTGRPYWWIFVLFMAPFIGPVLYFFVEILPGLRGARGGGFLDSLKPRKWRIHDLRTRLEESDTHENRLALAAELSEAGDQQGAHDTALECLQGVFRDDGDSIVQVARYKVELGHFEDALALMARVKDLSDRRVAMHLALLRGDAGTGLGRYEEAEEAYHSIETRFIGEAVRAGLARVYAKTGRTAEALAIWRDIHAKYRRASASWRRSEKGWYRLAAAELKAAQS